MPIFNYHLPIFKLYPSSDTGTLTNLDINIKCPDEIAFSAVTLKLKKDSPKPIPKSKDENLEHYYKLYKTAWINVKNDNSDKNKYKCLQCGKLFNILSKLFPHINFHRNDRLYKCEYCTKTYFSAKSLSSHRYNNHSEKINWAYYCPICEKGYMVKYAFMRHLEAEAAK